MPHAFRWLSGAVGMVFFFNYDAPAEVEVIPPLVTRHGRAVDVYTFGPGMVSLMGVQAGTLRVAWGAAFEEEVQNRQGVGVGEVLGPPKGAFTLEGLWVRDPVLAPADMIRGLVGRAFQYKGSTYRVKEVEHVGANRDFLKATLTGTAMAGVDGNEEAGLTYVGGVLGDGPESGPTVDIYGVWTATRMRRVSAPVSANAIPELGDAHPRFSFLKFQGCGEARTGRGYCELPLIYKGLRTSPGPLRAKLDVGTSEEPIQSHPRFADMANIDRVMDVIEALRRGDLRLGIFPGDGVPDVILSGLALELYQRILKGNEAYLEAGASFTNVQYYSGAVSDPGNPGTLGGHPTGAPVYPGRTWLYSGMQLIEEGPSLIRAERTWLLSARGGWDTTLYG